MWDSEVETGKKGLVSSPDAWDLRNVAPVITPIAELEDGTVATIRGRVHAAIRTVDGPDGVDCVYYDRGKAEGADGPDVEAFWLEDDGGRVLIPADFEVKGGDLTHEEEIDVIDADVKQVAARLTDLKRQVRQAQGKDHARFEKLRVEQRALKDLATVLCCIRAQAHGKVHGGTRTLEQQAEFIQARGEELRSEGHALRSIELALQVRQALVAVGDEVLVHAAFHDAPMPPGLGSTGGYRDRPTCLQARRRSTTEPIQVSPTADSHAAEMMEARTHAAERESPAAEPAKRSPTTATRPSTGATPAQIAGGVLLAAMVAFYLYLIM
jgi:ASC-1-like (ASCH) protein